LLLGQLGLKVLEKTIRNEVCNKENNLPWI